MQLRDYQQDCVDLIESIGSGSFLIQMATGCGKTATFTNLPRHGRVLVIAHREELIRQPVKYFNCPVGIEMAKEKSNGEEVVIASVQSLVKRLKNFKPDAFDRIIIDEAHHAASTTYKKVLDYFKPRQVLGFTATPNRSDNARLDNIFSKIIFKKDLKWAIQNKFLCDIKCMRVNIGYDISKVAKRMGDYAAGELEEALNNDVINQAVAQAYKDYARGATLIFATSVEHAKNIAELIPGAVAVTADTKNRQEIIDKFTNREIPCIVNCMIFTEGTDMPLVETVIMARPTTSSSLYTQMVGRGLRLHPDKEKLLLIDCVGVTGKADLCTAPSLIGLDMDKVPKELRNTVEGDLFDLPAIIDKKSDCIEAWIKNVEYVNLWAKEQKYNTHNINYFKMPNGDLILNLPGKRISLKAPDMLGKTILFEKEMDMQEALDEVYNYLHENQMKYSYIWDLSIAKKWGKAQASEKQRNLIRQRLRIDIPDSLTKLEASHILNRVLS